MPEFASVAAYVVIDTFVLLIWHQKLFSRVCREAPWTYLHDLVKYYIGQCEPASLFSVAHHPCVRTRQMFVPDLTVTDESA
jgi:hypothetical protein